MQIVPVIMAGGSGTRLWPLSRSLFPKQFLALASNVSMLQQTIERTAGLPCEKTVLLCNEEHRFLVAEQLRTINYQGARILLEPAGRNTAPAIALAAFDIVAKQKDSLMMVMAADHVINDQSAFEKSVLNAVELAQQGKLVTFGIVPNAPETGYGYIKRGTELQDSAYAVDAFVEKPNLETAQSYLTSGEYYWNSGMFMFKASTYLASLREFAPAIYEACQQAYNEKSEDLDFIRAGKDAFLSSPDDSIDYAIMEHTSQAVVVPMDAGWCDLGSWSALWEIDHKDDAQNSTHGDVILHNTTGSLVRATSRLVTTIGLEDIIIVETKDAVLVAAKDQVQDVKEIVNKLKQEDRSEFKHHRDVYRPWGHYDSIDCGDRYQVKRITVKPGAKLSVQMHHHRAEHWIVVSGTAKVTNGDKEVLLTENQSTYIPVGVIHALENPGKIDLELIEVQSGSYLGEDDIVRFADNYGRV
ncbi:mannose-1-phosphate guanylyltransferase/mannose-6-phosphate isomerase [Shewanella benthica]|uniref:mannose-1-phosphate guanylyltransferase/mannose-6-phosphate isomerase n=1 Tax=Shewanella benthica TaxID=43661 RepID=UPI00187A86C1|nr:mannose-1-phosphate guanylyltransferase/mannose-6-phosphate isomerase [Shewanella benthica]MBE7213916.1 mannose-1-phosphate guanylyltransferase/mannose-6-phosphate isomerase [Shewanella benthica]MCL1061822.1 mannose-1-phosphate guanylyltransferase/mannose-6-phosphate isomerase [Shewanella benthica]